MQECLVMGVKELAIITQVHTTADSMGINGDKQFALNGIVKGVDLGTKLSTLPLSRCRPPPPSL